MHTFLILMGISCAATLGLLASALCVAAKHGEEQSARIGRSYRNY